MDIHQLKTFVTVAREGSITRASRLLHLSQPAVSAHIKAIEDALGLTLFERTARGMSVTPDGRRLLAKAEQTIAAHQELMAEAARGKPDLTGTLRLGAGSNANYDAIGKLITGFAERHPKVQVALKNRSSKEILADIRNGNLDAGFYNEPGEAEGDLATVEVARFAIFLVAAPGVLRGDQPVDWRAVSEMPWIYPTESACCTRAAEQLFASHRFKPSRVISTDRQDVTRTLVASGVGIGLLHAEAAKDAERRGEVQLLLEAETNVRVLFAYLASRANDPVLAAASSILGTASAD
jgi:DNA-binding transcriptional LysR family regulator